MCRYYEQQIIDKKIKVCFVPERGPGHKMKEVDY